MLKKLRKEQLEQKQKVINTMCIIKETNWEPVESFEFQDTSPSPEDILIAKDTLKVLSTEAKQLIEIIVNAPSECYTTIGNIKKISLIKRCKTILGWSKLKTECTLFEVRFFLQNAYR